MEREKIERRREIEKKKTWKMTRESTDGGKNVSKWPLRKLEQLFLCECDNTPSLA